MKDLKYTNEYIDLVKENRSEYYDDFLKFKKSVEKSKAIYKGKPIPVTYQGFLFSEKDLENFKSYSETMIEIGRKVTKKYLEDEEFRKKFNFSRELEGLILVDPGYDMPVPICRYDIFYNGDDDFVFCELNTDGSSAMNEEREITSRLLKTKAMRDFSQKYGYKLEQFELFDSLVEEFESLYRDIKEKSFKPEEISYGCGLDEMFFDKDENGFYKSRFDYIRPKVAIVDFVDKGTSAEFEEFKDAFQKRGLECKIVDPRDLEYKNGRLVYKDFEIDLVYRRAVTKDILDRYSEISDFIEAYKAGAFIMFGSFRSQLMHSKLIFQILKDENRLEIFDDKERKFIKDHIPNTKKLISYEDYKELLENKDRYILKPYDGYASQGIIVGKDMSVEAFEESLKKIKPNTYIYQEFFSVETTPFVVFGENGNLHVEEFSHVIGLFSYCEKFKGMYSRIGQKSIISGASTYFMAPNIKVLEK